MGGLWLCAAALAAAGAAAATERSGSPRWTQLPSLPDREGFAAPFAGISQGALLVAGGANFPDKRPWDGGTKVWYDTVFLLPDPHGAWQTAGRLPQPRAYGVSVTAGQRVLCAGGGDATSHSAEVLALAWNGQQLEINRLPPLPRPCAFMCGALVGNIFYIAGGLETPDAAQCLNTLWAFDVAAGGAWKELAPCPGGERMLAVAGATGDTFYLLSGTKLVPPADASDPAAKPVRQYLRDAWSYRPGHGWRPLADLPRAAVAAPSPAFATADSRLLVVSGDDGLHVGFRPETAHPGFPRDVLAYDVAANAWQSLGPGPLSRATVPTTMWHGKLIIPNGEKRPGYRSPEVWSMSCNPSEDHP